MFIQYTDNCYGCEYYRTKECDECFEKKHALAEIETEHKKKLDKKD